jgi:hypothetical protein
MGDDERHTDSPLEPLEPLARFGSAKRPGGVVQHDRPSGMDDATVEALGKVSEALEVVEHARGLLYAFHRHCGLADLTLQEGVRQLRDAGHAEVADELEGHCCVVWSHGPFGSGWS